MVIVHANASLSVAVTLVACLCIFFTTGNKLAALAPPTGLDCVYPPEIRKLKVIFLFFLNQIELLKYHGLFKSQAHMASRCVCLGPVSEFLLFQTKPHFCDSYIIYLFRHGLREGAPANTNWTL